MAEARKTIGKILEDMKIVTPEQIKEALIYQRKEGKGKKLGEIFIEKNWATEEDIAKALAVQFDLLYIDLKEVQPEPDLLTLVPKSVAKENRIFPLKKEGNVLTIAFPDPLDLYALDNLRFILGTELECVLSSGPGIDSAIERCYDHQGGVSLESAAGGKGLEEVTDLEMAAAAAEGDEAPIIRLVNLIISEAAKSRASDIHIDPMNEYIRVRYRIDGVLREVESPPKRLQSAFLSRIKLMAKMQIEEKRHPQDGKIRIAFQGRTLDLRVASLPTGHGESLVLRILDKEASLVSVEDLGFHPTDYKRFKGIMKKPNGVILVTGPTGSGKTTTLYAVLKEFNKPNVKIITAENPVEYVLPGVNQVNINEKIGLTFARVIRAMLRQAPNIILVGEIRDQETADTAVQAALTGHLVLSTLHTNDAPSAITRLTDMGVKPFLVASSIQAVLAQRLIRILCPQCKQPYEPEMIELRSAGITPEDIQEKTLYRPVGCENCKGLGFRGRKGIYELMEMDSEVRELAFKRAPLLQIKEMARTKGMVTLLEDGVRKVLDGLTTISEVLNVARREDMGY